MVVELNKNICLFFFSFKDFFLIYLFLDSGREGEERETSVCGCLL